MPALTWTPEGKPAWHPGWMNGLARGIQLTVNHLGGHADYDTVMGDLGLAFILQGQENGDNLIDGAVDVGWWPLEPMGIIRLSFLENTVGRKISDIKPPWDELSKDPGPSFAGYFRPGIERSLAERIPCLVQMSCTWYIITGIDEDEFPMWGMCPNEQQGQEKVYRIREPLPPYAMVTLGEACPVLDRRQADHEALRFAVALHEDEVLDGSRSHEYGLRRADQYGITWRTGRKSLAAWIACLEDTEHPGQHFWHSNVVGFLGRNRATAIRYLTAMRQRHGRDVSDCLQATADSYRQVAETAARMETGKEAFHTPDGRAALVARIGEIMQWEDRAADALRKALRCLD